MWGDAAMPGPYNPQQSCGLGLVGPFACSMSDKSKLAREGHWEGNTVPQQGNRSLRSDKQQAHGGRDVLPTVLRRAKMSKVLRPCEAREKMNPRELN